MIILVYRCVIALGSIPIDRSTDLLTVATDDVESGIAKQARELLLRRAF